MSWADACRLAARSVLRRPGRTALTMVAVALAAALFTAMLTMAATAQGRVLNQLAKGGPLSGIQVAAAAPNPSQIGSDNPSLGSAKPIDQAALDRIARLPDVQVVLPIVTSQTLVVWPGHTVTDVSDSPGGSVVFDQMVGVDLTRITDFPVTLSAGRFPAPGSLTEVDVTPVLLARYGIPSDRAFRAIGSVLESAHPGASAVLTACRCSAAAGPRPGSSVWSRNRPAPVGSWPPCRWPRPGTIGRRPAIPESIPTLTALLTPVSS